MERGREQENGRESTWNLCSSVAVNFCIHFVSNTKKENLDRKFLSMLTAKEPILGPNPSEVYWNAHCLLVRVVSVLAVVIFLL